MPYELSWEDSGVVFRFSGVVSDEELVAANEEVYASPLFPIMRYQIFDVSMIEKFQVSSEAVRAAADSDRSAAKRNPDVKVAIIITSSPFLRGLANMYALSHEAHGGSWVTETFEREEDGRAWAGAGRL